MTLNEWLTELEELDKKATDGPWHNCSIMFCEDNFPFLNLHPALEFKTDLEPFTAELRANRFDYKFIEKSRTALPKAISVIRYLCDKLNDLAVRNHQDVSENEITINEMDLLMYNIEDEIQKIINE